MKKDQYNDSYYEYGAMYANSGNYATFSMLEYSNKDNIVSPNDFDEQSIKEFLESMGYKNFQIEKIENKKLGEKNAKYTKLKMIGSNSGSLFILEIYFVTHLNKLYFIQTTSTQKDYENLNSKKVFSTIFSSIKFK